MNRYLAGAYVLGDASIVNNGDAGAILLQLAEQMIAQSSEADALSVAGDINQEMQGYVTQFTQLGRQDLVSSATDLGNRAYDLVTNYDATNGDPSLPGKVSQLQHDVNQWHPLAWAALAQAPGSSGGGSGGTTAAVPTISAFSDVTTPTANQAPAPSPYGGMMSGGANVGDAVNITGTNFTGATSVTFGGVPAQFSVVSPTQITAFVPAGAPTGPVQVTTPAGTATSTSVLYMSAPGAGAGGAGAFGGGDFGGGGGGFGGGGFGGGGDGGIDWGDDGGGDGADAGDDAASDLEAEADASLPDDGGLLDDSDIDWGDGSDGGGSDVMGSTTTVPAAVSYTDHDTVLAVQTALKVKGFDPGELDGIFGPKTSKAIKKMQTAAGLGVTGVVDYGVLQALGVQAPAYTPTTTTMGGRSPSATAADAASDADSATTPAAVQAASQQVEAANAVALPPPSPEVQTKVAQAAAAARAARTPAEVKAAAQQVKDAAQAVASATSFWGAPLWPGAPVRRWQGVVGGAAAVAVGLALALIARRR